MLLCTVSGQELPGRPQQLPVKQDIIQLGLTTIILLTLATLLLDRITILNTPPTMEPDGILRLLTNLSIPSGYYGSRNTLTLDGSNLPHIAYSVEGSGGNPNTIIKYAKWTATNWEMEMVESSSSARYSSVVLSFTGSTPHICYTTSTGGSLHYSYKNETIWINETVDPNDDVFDAFISLDSNGCPHISYSTVDGLKYASKCYLLFHGLCFFQVELITLRYSLGQKNAACFR